MNKTTHPILLKGPMVRAVLEGRQTQHRVPVRGHAPKRFASPFGAPGHTLWVRETWAANHPFDAVAPNHIANASKIMGKSVYVHYAATDDLGGLIKRPSIHMPRWASRIDLLVKRVWVERVQDISETDAIAEGSYLARCECLPKKKDRTPIEILFEQTGCHIHGLEFKSLWNSIYGKKHGCSWEDNPCVWAVEFEIKEASDE